VTPRMAQAVAADRISGAGCLRAGEDQPWHRSFVSESRCAHRWIRSSSPKATRPRRSSVLVREGKGDDRREVGIDGWAMNTGLRPWLEARAALPVGPLFCAIDGPTRGARAWSSVAVRAEFRHLAADS
jgi:hypothetical protein